MTALHQRHFTEADRNIYAAIGNSLAMAGTTGIRLDKGQSHAQKFSNRCAAAAVWNVLETCDDQWTDPPERLTSPQEIYLAARALDDFAEYEPGTSLTAAAEAACRILGHGIRWMALPHNDPQILAAWLATEKTGIAFGTVWTGGDETPIKRNLIPTEERVGPGHAVHLHGFDSRHTWRRWFWQARKPMPSFIVENSHKHPELDFYYPASRVPAHGIAAIVFIPPNY